MTADPMEQARAVADAVLYEGYLLYPYRASAAKNKVRWQWGVLMPAAYAAEGNGERSATRTELIAEPGADAVLHVRVRFLQVQARTVEVPDDGNGYRAVPSVVADGNEYTCWDEAVEREFDAVLPFSELRAEQVVPFTVAGGSEVEPIPGDARLVRTRALLEGALVLSAEAMPGPFGGYVLRLAVRNTSPWRRPGAVRDEALKHALVAAHTMLSLSSGGFLSATDPPEWASVATKECVNDGAWPVLLGEPGQRDTMLCSPIILYDYPSIAPESAGNLYDGTEIDEILTLRTMTLTDEEKREARATDARAAELIDRVDHLPPELIERLHGTVRYLKDVTERKPATDPPQTPWWDPGADASMSPETDSVLVNGVPVSKGSRVRLRPGRRRADAHDMFLDGKVAVVQAVLLDVDDDWHIAVTLEDDLGSELFAAHGRYRYFATDEIEPL